MRVQRHTNVSEQTTLLNGVDVGPPKWHICGLGLKHSVHKGMEAISIVKVHLNNHSRNVNISVCMQAVS